MVFSCLEQFGITNMYLRYLRCLFSILKKLWLRLLFPIVKLKDF